MRGGEEGGFATAGAVMLSEGRRRLLLAVILLGSLAAAISLGPVAQNVGFHRFADQRVILGVPNFFDVTSNVAFLLVGAAGLAFCHADRGLSLRGAWLTCFAGVAIVSAGSAYYHLNPNNATLVWDRLPITIAFMGLLAAVLGEYVDERLGKILLVPAVALGLLSVLYWHWFDDLRLYAWIQLVPMLTIPVVMILFRHRYTHQWLLLLALALYGLAKLAEVYDREVFALAQLLSGHTLKHLIAALSCYAVLASLTLRKPAA